MKYLILLSIAILIISCQKQNDKPIVTLGGKTNVKNVEAINPINIYLFDVSRHDVSNKNGFLFLTENGHPIRTIKEKKYNDTLKKFFNGPIDMIDCCDSNVSLTNEPKSIVFIIDKSSSMLEKPNNGSESKLDIMKRNLIEFVNSHEDIEFSIIECGTTSKLLSKNYVFNNNSCIVNLINSISSTTSEESHYDKALNLLIEFVKENQRANHNVYLISDGDQPLKNSGKSDNLSNADYTAFPNEFKENKISFFSVFFNHPFNSRCFMDLSNLDGLNGWCLNDVNTDRLFDALNVIYLINLGYKPCKAFWRDEYYNISFKDGKVINYYQTKKINYDNIADVYLSGDFENEYHFFCTGYYYPSTEEIMKDLKSDYDKGYIGKNTPYFYVADPDSDIDPITKNPIDYYSHSDDIKKNIIEANRILKEFREKLNKDNSQFSKLITTVFGYADSRNIDPGKNPKYFGFKISQRNFKIKKGDSFDNDKLAFLRAYFTYYIINTLDYGVNDYPMNIINNKNIFINKSNDSLIIESKGVQKNITNDSINSLGEIRRASIRLKLLKKEDCPCMYQK